MQKIIKKTLVNNTPKSSPLYCIISQLNENKDMNKNILNKLAKSLECWKRYLILNNYIELTKSLPSVIISSNIFRNYFLNSILLL